MDIIAYWYDVYRGLRSTQDVSHSQLCGITNKVAHAQDNYARASRSLRCGIARVKSPKIPQR
jgi:hypothetical protein